MWKIIFNVLVYLWFKSDLFNKPQIWIVIIKKQNRTHSNNIIIAKNPKMKTT